MLLYLQSKQHLCEDENGIPDIIPRLIKSKEEGTAAP